MNPRQKVMTAIGRESALLMLIGPRWLETRDATGKRRIDELTHGRTFPGSNDTYIYRTTAAQAMTSWGMEIIRGSDAGETARCGSTHCPRLFHKSW